MKTKTIVLVHGLSASKHSWDGWAARYHSGGYKVVAPAYHPGLDKSLAELKQTPNDPLLRWWHLHLYLLPDKYMFL